MSAGHRCWRTARCSTAPTRTCAARPALRAAGGGHGVWVGTAAPPDLPAVAAGEVPGLRWAYSDLDGPGRVLLAVGEPRAVGELLAAQLLTSEPAEGAAPAPSDRPCTAAGHRAVPSAPG